MNYSNRAGKHLVWSALSAVAATALIFVGSGSTQAGEVAYAPPQSIVKYRDLDLRNPQDVQVLYRRIQGAASAVCGDYDARDLSRRAAARACIDQAISKAVDAVDNPFLTSLHDTKTGRTQKVAAIAPNR